MTEKSILEQALLQVQNLEEAVKQNAKGILASTMKEELKDLLKESLEEEEESTTEEEVEKPEEEVEQDVTADDEEADDESGEDVDADVDMDTDLDNDETDTDVEADVDMDMDADTDMDTDSESMDDEGSMDDDDVMDMTSASDDEVLKVFKAMKPEDGIVVKKDGNSVEFGDGEDEYIIKLDGEDSSDVDSDFGSDMGAEVDEEWNEEDMSSDDQEEETIYEIELDEEEESEVSEEEESEVSEEEEESKKVEATEAARTKSNPHGNKNGMKRAGLPSKKMYKAGSTINEEVETLKKQNAEYKKALVLFKDKLNEVAVFNANLAYATRLFTEHSTTKQEKLNILKRFDTVSTMNESKNLFNTIKTELGSKTTVTESVATKISNTPSTSSSTEVLSESKAYENPQFSRIKEMMRKIK